MISTFGEVFEVDPKIKIAKNSDVPFVEMADIEPWARTVGSKGTKKFAGGSKFLDGDVLVARITPSLENGKTSIYRASRSEKATPAAGSTEFIVVRGVAGRSLSEFAYYLLRTADLRSHLIANMNGSSGRQRIQSDALHNYVVDLPSLEEQQRVVEVLGALDDKIESNRAQQRIGEQLLRAVIEGILHQFSEADFISFGAYCTQSKESVRPENVGNGDKYIALEHMPRGSIFLNSWEIAELAGIASNKTRFRHGDLLFGKLRPYFKKVGVTPVSGVCSTDILVIRPRLPEFLPFIAVIASSDALIDSISASATGTRMPRASWRDIAAWTVPHIPDETLTVLLDPANQLMAFLETLSLQNLKLEQLRDALLPELMSGRMRVDEAGRLVSEALDEEVADV